MKNISINNGNTWTTAAEALEQVKLNDMVVFMDDDARELANNQCAIDCTDEEWLELYLTLTEYDLIIG